MKNFNKYIYLGIFIASISGCTSVSTGIGMGVGFGGGSSSFGLSTGVSVPLSTFSSDSQYRKFYNDNYNALVKRYNAVRSSKNPDLNEITEIRIKMTALKQEVNTNWKNINSNKAYISNFNKKIDPQIANLIAYENNLKW
ncbi:hypothetical protein [Fusobacterium sp. PH5-44]|uniref:hypothetical protein n=1 Tax=unclassified Fusobacterium TaxID=2648384 RepID=UPI003D2389F0